MANVFLISDTHFGHTGVCRFTTNDGSKLRPWDNPEEMDEALVKNWNSVVRPNDKVYHLGDVVIAKKNLQIMHRLNGDKVLIRGNHDIFKLKDYTEHFRDIRGVHVMNGIILSHIPLHDSCMTRFGVNVHGHLHSNRVMKGIKNSVIDERYFSVCVEQINYTPISLEDVKRAIVSQGGSFELKPSERNSSE